MDYHDKTAVVTGASSGLGAGISHRLASLGCHVLLVARRAHLLEEVAAGIAADGGEATAIQCDVTDDRAVKALAEVVRGQFGRLHLLVNNAGIAMNSPLQVQDVDAARDIFELNVLAVARVIKAMLPFLKPGSAVVNMASAAAIRGAATMSLYSASKGGVVAMTRSLALEFAGRKIRVNAVAPGVVRTELSDSAFARLTAGQIAELEACHPLGLGQVEDVAASVAFLGSEEAKWLTGHTLVVDGGFTA
jgi:NAD(P)-dependent dehydrogenase (short-subunit alcohol dehydrogenase family)